MNDTFLPRDPRDDDSARLDPFGFFAFFGVLLLLGGIVYATVKGPRVALPDVDFFALLPMPADAVTERLAAALPDTTPLPTPTLPPAFGLSFIEAPTVQPTPTVYVPPFLMRHETPTPAPTVALPTPQPKPTNPPAPSPSPTATATAKPTTLRVANTGGDGVYIRRTPRLADTIIAWPDNATMQALGEEADGDGMRWVKVRDPAGNVGWVPKQYLAAG